MKYLSLALLFLCCLVGCQGCEDDDIAPRAEECEGRGQCGPGNITCEDGRCQCYPGHPLIAPKFCIQDTSGAVFVTYDTIRGLTDTMVVRFAEDPFDQTWRTGDTQIRAIYGETYNRNAYVCV